MHPKLPNSRGSCSASRAGVTLIEVMVAILVMTVGIYILSATLTTAIAHASSQQERSLAVEAVGNKVEEMRAAPIGEVFALYNGVAYDDPAGPTTGPGRFFDVPGLDPIIDAGGVPLPVGEVMLPSTTGVLREDVDMSELGLPRDLNGDLVIDGADHSRNYLVLPVVVRVRWMSRTGPRQHQMRTMLAELAKL
ncbi:MAG: prepilin-type N-terminal cleavage/methylation domain-containing protein [Planctomycetota bacterium]